MWLLLRASQQVVRAAPVAHRGGQKSRRCSDHVDRAGHDAPVALHHRRLARPASAPPSPARSPGAAGAVRNVCRSRNEPPSLLSSQQLRPSMLMATPARLSRSVNASSERFAMQGPGTSMKSHGPELLETADVDQLSPIIGDTVAPRRRHGRPERPAACQPADPADLTQAGPPPVTEHDKTVANGACAPWRRRSLLARRCGRGGSPP